jgi:hypothetical protein
MKGARRIAMLAAAGALAGTGLRADDWVDALDRTLTVSALHDAFRARLSGTLDLEGYQFTRPAPGIIDTEGDRLFKPRLTTFVDAQLGRHVYAFAQARGDRGFDPGYDSLRARLDEYELRLTPWTDGRLSVQIGKFATVVGNWIPRHGSWENPFVTAPLPYESLTSLWDVVAAKSGATVLDWERDARTEPEADKYRRLPIVWGPSYATGIAVSGGLGPVSYAAEIKNAALSSRPSEWDVSLPGHGHSTVSARLGYSPNPMWAFGVSASTGAYLQDAAAPTIPAGRGRADYRQQVLAQDAGFAWHHLQVWAEAYESRFAIPGVGDADVFSWYIETKYKFTPRFSGALRWNAQQFGDLPDGSGGRARWGTNLWRIDVAPTYRFTPHLQLKLQYSLQREDTEPRLWAHLVALQLTLRF